MNALWLIVIAIFATWGLLGLIILGIDARESRRHRELLEVRDWQKKVQAMRRMADQEGDA
jgi:hypothetical protein